MGTENPYIYFQQREMPASRKTKVVDVRSKSSGDLLGTIRWYGAWRQYTFDPAYPTIFNKGCLETIIEKIDELMAERRAL